jgi:cytochrome c oxidase subunit IV
MTDTNLTHDQEMRVESHAPYIKVFLALAVFTAIEYFYARIFKDSFTTLVLGLMFWAVIKASLVGWFFMHLKFEGKWVYYMLVPAGVLAAVFIFALMPDIAMQPQSDETSSAEEEETAAILAPLVPGPVRS